MNEQIQKEIVTRLDAIAAKLGLASGEIWRILIKQARVEAITDCIFAVVAILVFIASVKAIQCGMADEHDSSESLAIGGAICLIVSVVVFIACAFSIPTELFNPEYFAYQQILKGLK